VLFPVPSSPSKVMNFPRRDTQRNDTSAPVVAACNPYSIVILSEEVVREVDDFAVEGSLLSLSDWREEDLSLNM
jgi:hypothetical protein